MCVQLPLLLLAALHGAALRTFGRTAATTLTTLYACVLPDSMTPARYVVERPAVVSGRHNIYIGTEGCSFVLYS